MASEDDGYDYDDGVAYDYDDNGVYDYDDEYVYEGNDDGDYGIDIVGNDENLSEDIASNQGSHGNYRDPNDDDDDDDDEDDDHDVVVDSDSDDSGVIAFDSCYDLGDISQQMEKVHLECDGASNGNFGRASKGTALKYEMGIMSEKVYLEFDGASKGNPGRAGAGALLKSEDGTVITRVREGLGEGTNNDAEYRSLIQGLKTALDMGYDRIHAKGDSQLVVKQVKGEWQTRNDKMAEYRDEARKLSYQFKEFEISHIPRVYNSDADAEAQKAVNLPAGQVQKEGGNWH